MQTSVTDTETRLLEVEALCAQATPGPWYTEATGKTSHGFTCDILIAATAPGKHNRVYANPPGGTYPAADQAFIAAMREHGPWLLERARKLEKMLRRQGHDEGAEFSADLRVLTWYSTDWVHGADVEAVVKERDGLLEQVRTLSAKSEQSGAEVRTLEEQVKTLREALAWEVEARDRFAALANIVEDREAAAIRERDAALMQVSSTARALGQMEAERDTAMGYRREEDARALGEMKARAEAAEAQARLLAARGAEWATRAKAAEARIEELEDPPEPPKKCRSTFAFGRGSVRCGENQGHDGKHVFQHIDGPIEWSRRGAPNGK